MAQHATVVGHGRFPMDMLRYDRAYPRFGADGYTILQTGSDEAGTKTWEVQLSTDGKFTPERWNSFGVGICIDA
jgi:hypothetical protein